MTQIWLLLTCALHLFSSDYTDLAGAQLELAYQGIPIYSMQINQTQAGIFLSGTALLSDQQQAQLNPDSRGNTNLDFQETSRTPMQGGMGNSPDHLLFIEPSRRYSQVYMVFPFRAEVVKLIGLIESLGGGAGDNLTEEPFAANPTNREANREANRGASLSSTAYPGVALEETQELTDPLARYSTQVLPATIVDLTQVLLQIPGGFSSTETTTNLPRTIRVMAEGENIFMSRTPTGYIVGTPSRGISITITPAE